LAFVLAIRPRGGQARVLLSIAALVAGVVAWSPPVRADRPPPLSPRTIALPTGPTAMKGLGESFAPNPSMGAGTFAIPIDLPAASFKPTLTLQYTPGHGRSEVGASFHLAHLHVYRTKDKGAPGFQESDRFAVAGGDVNDELVPVGGGDGYYRLKNEGSFALFVRDAARDAWTIRFANGDTATLGTDEASRQSSSRGVYKWFVTKRTDASGQSVAYDYESDAGYVYLRAIRYRLGASGYEARVDFTYEKRTDPFTDFSYGSAVSCRRRLTRITTSAGCGLGCDRTTRTYVLTYDRTTQSFLRSVQAIGEGGVDALPTLQLTYVTPSSALGRTVTMPQSLPLDLLETGRAQLDDVNGDGLPDLLVGTARGYYYYENKTGAAWSDPITLSRSPDVSLDDTDSGAVLADIDGDGFRDVLRASSSGYSYFAGGNVQGGHLVAYLPPVTVAAPAGGLLWSDKTIRLADLNFDGRTDFLRADGARAIGDFNVRDASGGARVYEAPAGDLPLDVARAWSDPSLQMLDFNGDGTQDFVKNEIGWGESRLRVFYGVGGGKYENGKVVTAPKGNPADFLFGDIDGDGYVDLVKYSGQQIVYWLGAGDERFFGPIGPNNAWSAPPRSEARAVQLVDMDGSGTGDLVLFTNSNRVAFVSFFANPFLGLVSRIDNGMGLVTTIGYRSSTSFAVDAKQAGTPWRTTLPRAIPVVSEVTTTDSFDKIGLPATVKHTSYEYRDGYYDGKEREIRGFGYVRTIEDGDDHREARVTETWMHVGIDPDTLADVEVLKGKPYRQVVTNANGEVYTSQEEYWEPLWLCAEDSPDVQHVLPSCAPYPRRVDAKDQLVALAVRPWMLKGQWEKTTAPRFTLEVSAFDVWGHVTRRNAFGEVAFPAPHAIGDRVDVGSIDPFAGDDEIVETTAYANDTTRWLIGLPFRTEKRDARTDAVLAAEETYYDGNPFQGLPLGAVDRGLVTRKRAYEARTGRWIDRERMARDAFGHVTETLDALGNRTTVTYDAESHAFPTAETIDTERGPIGFTATYDTALGVILSSTDPNGAATRYAYDGLGRTTAIIDAESTEALPTRTFTYVTGTTDAPVSTVVDRQLVDRASGRYRTSYHHSDALGRARMTKTPNDAGDGYVASGLVVFGSGEKETLKYAEFASSTADIEPPPPSTPVTITFFDALGRDTRVVPPGTGTYLMTRYLPFETHVFDEEDTTEASWLYPAITRFDGAGRVRETIKYNDLRPASGGDRARTELRWTFGYDALGNLTRGSDPAGHLREYDYDALGHVTELRDPNIGAVRFAYDDAGNLITKTDSLGQIRAFVYGKANRLARIEGRSDASGRADYASILHYDEPQPGGPLPGATNVVGRLAWVEWPTGSLHASYDRVGRITSEAESLWDPARSTFEAQARDVFRRDRVYDPEGHAVRTDLPGGRALVSAFTERGKLFRVGVDRHGEVAPLVTGVTYAPDGKVRRASAANGTTACAWYTPRQELAAIAAGRMGSAACEGDPTRTIAGSFEQLVFERGASRLIRGIRDINADGGLPRLDATYAYDRLHELVAATSARGTDTYEYDAIQNLVAHASTVPDARAAVGAMKYGENGAGPNMVTTAGARALTYDRAGNMRSYDGYALGFDVDGRLVDAHKPGGASIRHYYDFDGERRITVVARPGAAPEVHRFVFDEYQVQAGEEIWQAGGGLVSIEMRRGAGGAETVQTTYKDHLTGTTHATDESGTLVGFQQYGPYGELRARIGRGPLRGFAGARNEPEEDLGLSQFGSRFYAPGIGRWISADRAIAESPKKILERPLEASLYGYVANDPVNHIDPVGKDGTISVVGNTITIDVKLYFYGKGATKENVDQIRNDIIKEWGKKANGDNWTYTDPNTKKVFTVKWKVTTSIIDDAPWFKLGPENYIELRPDAYAKKKDDGRSQVSGWGNTGVWNSAGRNGRAFADDDDAPHEFGHLLGLNDHYTDDGGPNKGWEENIMARGAFMGKVEQRNIDAIVRDAVDYATAANCWHRGTPNYTTDINPLWGWSD
jgi:RHS repeat-associated protein